MLQIAKSKVSFQIDRNYQRKDISPEQILENKKNLGQVIKNFLDLILRSVDAIPKLFRNICYHFYNLSKQKFPDAVRNSIAGLYFLRVLTPAILSFSMFGISGKFKPEYNQKRLFEKYLFQIQNPKLNPKRNAASYSYPKFYNLSQMESSSLGQKISFLLNLFLNLENSSNKS